MHLGRRACMGGNKKGTSAKQKDFDNVIPRGRIISWQGGKKSHATPGKEKGLAT